MAVFPQPGSAESSVSVKSRYDNYIGGEWVPPVKGLYFGEHHPVTGKPFTEIARSNAEDIDKALDAAHAAKDAWGKTPAARSVVLNKIADTIEANLQDLAIAETWENGKSVRETMAADLPLAVDHFRYFAGVIRAQEGGISEIDENTVAYHIQEPLGVVGQIIPWNFPDPHGRLEARPGLAAGNCVVMKPAEQTPWSILKSSSSSATCSRGRAQHRQRVRRRGRQAARIEPRIAKIAFTGETTTGRLIMQYASANLIPVTLELPVARARTSFFDSVAAEKDAFYDKALEGFTMFALNQGEVCTCPSRALIQDSIYDQFLGDALERVGKIKQGNPLDTDTMIGAQASNDQLEKDPLLHGHWHPGRRQDPRWRPSRRARRRPRGRYYVQPTVSEGNNAMRIFQEEIFGPVAGGALLRTRPRRCRSPTTRSHGLGAGVWSRNGSQAYWSRSRHPGRPRVDQLLPRLPRARRLWWLQEPGIGREKPQDDAVALPEHEKPSRVLQPQRARLLLNRWTPAAVCRPLISAPLRVRGSPEETHSVVPNAGGGDGACSPDATVSRCRRRHG
ncbi:MAG: aldehyde dehydrogenase family protein [Tetrasphaera sp.]|nr:aldehyde dehydrogenase family protein [Tetrasphaera sp.]